ncbi:MAG: hypothetical protein HOG03_12390 [Desulfobacula sp.]|jgi:hypothetical protein|uniref:hypothetical protein n=1 Tax=Desulfobacula sp. TaxID=2593537 RepID=UPI001D46918A|nr:hypothetical protein [Desulfobacula sp.]MBT3486401.1 hypothetical protein [Desulfobacula sp.]MBT3805377.1 hypothetical protein [Desulfobacula sp.]MBT4024531.1 hypothetical protein [Desulfobacula sp.]MBT4199847.1 hypothetical protein [Desulfobacula sp.]
MKKVITKILVFIALIGLSMIGQDSDDIKVFYFVNILGISLFMSGVGFSYLLNRKRRVGDG